MSSDIIYRTDSLSLCPYLVMHGLNYIKTESSESGTVVFLFEDPEGKGDRLSLDYTGSAEREYKSRWQFFRNEIQKHLKKNK